MPVTQPATSDIWGQVQPLSIADSLQHQRQQGKEALWPVVRQWSGNGVVMQLCSSAQSVVGLPGAGLQPRISHVSPSSYSTYPIPIGLGVRSFAQTYICTGYSFRTSPQARKNNTGTMRERVVTVDDLRNGCPPQKHKSGSTYRVSMHARLRTRRHHCMHDRTCCTWCTCCSQMQRATASH